MRQIARTFPFDEASAAHHFIQDRKNIGKVGYGGPPTSDSRAAAGAGKAAEGHRRRGAGKRVKISHEGVAGGLRARH